MPVGDGTAIRALLDTGGTGRRRKTGMALPQRRRPTASGPHRPPTTMGRTARALKIGTMPERLLLARPLGKQRQHQPIGTMPLLRLKLGQRLLLVYGMQARLQARLMQYLRAVEEILLLGLTLLHTMSSTPMVRSDWIIRLQQNGSLKCHRRMTSLPITDSSSPFGCQTLARWIMLKHGRNSMRLIDNKYLTSITQPELH